MKANRILFLAAVSALCAVNCQAGGSSSADYSIAADNMGSSGSTLSSADYSALATAGGIGGMASEATSGYFVKNGFAGQIYDVTGVTPTAPASTVNEGGTLQLGVSAELDDDTLLALDPVAASWSVVSGPIASIIASGLATAGMVYQDTAATVSASWQGFTGSLNLTVLNPGPAGPEIAVEQPAGTNLADGSSSIDFGSVNLGSSNPLTFTVKNLGTVALTGLAVTKDGANVSDYTLGSLGASSLAPGGSTTFTVTFSPAAIGSRAAAFHIASNDSDENPFDIALTGTGTSTKAVMASPVPGSTLTGSSATFEWSAGSSATGYLLHAGSSLGANDYYNSGQLVGSILSQTVSGLPTDGSTVYVRLWSLVAGVWVSNDYTYTAFGSTSTKGVMTTPANGSALPSGPVTFAWNAGSSATGYLLYVGSSKGGKDYYNSGQLASSILSKTVSGLPTNGILVYVRLWSLVLGSWAYNDYTYTAFGATSSKGVITTPANGSTLPSGPVTFAWNPGGGATAYLLYAGSSQGARDYFNSGQLASNVLSQTVSGLPTNGSTVYVRLWSLAGGTWVYNDYTYTAFGSASAKAVMTTPANGSTLPSGPVTFVWNPGSSATAYMLYVGSTVGGKDYYNSGQLAITIRTKTVSGLPTNGSTVYVRLWSMVAGAWVFNDYIYTAPSS